MWFKKTIRLLSKISKITNESEKYRSVPDKEFTSKFLHTRQIYNQTNPCSNLQEKYINNAHKNILVSLFGKFGLVFICSVVTFYNRDLSQFSLNRKIKLGYELPHELQNELRLSILENKEILEKFPNLSSAQYLVSSISSKS